MNEWARENREVKPGVIVLCVASASELFFFSLSFHSIFLESRVSCEGVCEKKGPVF